MRTRAGKSGAAVWWLAVMVVGAGLASCTYNFGKFTEAQDAVDGVGGSFIGAVDADGLEVPGTGRGGTTSASGGSADASFATGGVAGAIPPTGGAAGAPAIDDGSVGAGGTVGAGGLATGGVVRGSGGAGGTGTGGVGTGGTRPDGGGTGGVGTGGVGTGGVARGSGGAGGSGTGGVGTGGTRLDGGGTGGGGGASVDGGASPDPDLVLWYKFDEASGTAAADSALFGGTARDAKLETVGNGGNATFTIASQVGTHAVALTPVTSAPVTNGGYVTVASVQPLAPSALTIAVWVNLASSNNKYNWERIFDFGTGTNTNNFLYLVARAGSPSVNPVQFVISTKGHSASAGQTINSPSALTPNAWHHVAIVLPAGSPYTGTMYIDGVAVATNTAMTLHASDIGPTTNNYLGRSQFGGESSGDPLFNGSMDDFRVYKRALSQQEISALVALR